MALAFYKQGWSHADVGEALELTGKTVEREMELDPEWSDQVQDAIAEPFTPLLKKAYELAQQADAYGEKEGAHKALALIFKFVDKNLDREHAERLLNRKGEIAKEVAANTAPPVTNNIVLSSPEQIEAMAREAHRQELEADIVDIKTD